MPTTTGTSPFPPPVPTVNGSLVTVDQYLQNPTRVTRVLQRLNLQRYISDLIFGAGPAVTGGAVLYDQLTANDLFLLDDVERIEPGMDHPILTDEAPTPKIAAVGKWGGRVFITYEQRDRNRTDVLNRELIKLSNTIVRKVDTVAIATLNAAPILTFGGVDWTNAADNVILSNLIDAFALVNDPDMGYEVDTVLLNPVQSNDMLKNKSLRDALGPTAQEAIVRGASMGRLLNADFYKTNRVAAGTGYALMRKMVGGVSDEQPLRSRTYETEQNERIWVQANRRLVPYVTDPLCVVKLLGI
jgi:hypothetical protein